MKKVVVSLVILTSIALVPFACKTQKSAASNECAAVEAKYSLNIAPIITEKCMPCHKQGSLRGDFTTYNGLNAVAASGDLKKMVFDKMAMPPADKPQLSDEQKKMIKCWLMNGHQNN